MNDGAEKLFKDAFSVPRDPRSQEYKDGVLAALKYRLEGVKIQMPYAAGTAQADAFYSGLTEGHGIYRTMKSQ